MTIYHGTQMTKLRVDPVSTPDPGFVDGGVLVFNEEIILSSQTTTDTIEVARLPKGAIPLLGVIETDTSLGTATIAIGTSVAAGKYRAAATFTVVNTPTLFGVGSAIGEATADEEIVIVSIGAASLPATGTLRVLFFYTVN
jgi:hypothetical protein